jgi:hypothetical protein
MIVTCPKCRREIPLADLNVANDVALCRTCNLVHKFSSLVQAAELEQGIDFTRPPAGTWYRNSGLGAVIGATHRSFGSAMGLLAVSLFWNGIVSIFVCLAVSATLRLLHVPAPAWFPFPKMNGNEMGLGMTIFLWLFLTPFIVIGLAMVLGFLMSLGGRTEVTIRNGQGVIYSGIGALGRRKRFNPQFVKDVRLEDKRWRDSDGDARRSRQIVIEMQEGKPIQLGSTLREDRMKFVAAALHRALRP